MKSSASRCGRSPRHPAWRDAPTCKYHPTCSQYAPAALRKHGLLKGIREDRVAAAPLQSVEPRGVDYPMTLGFESR